MTLTELRYIVTLAQEQHFGHAAERCHVSQPTLSVGVKKLEDELGVLIFERSKSAVRLTPVGEGIVAQAQKVLEQAQGIRELAQAGKNQLTRSEEHTSELQSQFHLVCRLLLEKKKKHT